MLSVTTKVVSVSEETINKNESFHFHDDEQYIPAANILKKALFGAPEKIWLSGGEPLNHPDILKILTALKVSNIRAGVMTTGVKLADSEFVTSLKYVGLESAMVVLPGLSGPLYKNICKEDHWDQARQSLDNIISAGIKLILDIPLFLTSLISIRGLINLCNELGKPDIRFFYPRILKKHYNGLHSRLDLVAVAIQAMADNYDGRVFVSGIPQCFPVGRAKRIPPGNIETPWESRHEKLNACLECRDSKICPGIPKGYTKIHGAPDNGPFIELISSSFDFADTGRTANGTPVSGPECFALSVLSEQDDPQRNILIIPPDKTPGNTWSLFKTDTRDFTPQDIKTIVKDAGQLYWDASSGPDVTDFAGQLIRMEMADVCRKCGFIDKCPGCFTPVSGPPFQQEVRVIAELISKMRGRILDVGAGEGYYRDTIRNMVDAGTVEYHALDPKEKSLEILLTHMPRAITHVGDIETTRLPIAGFDNIMAIRSVNHFKSLHHAFDNIVKMLKTGGGLIVTDGLALPLARTRAKAGQAHSQAEGGFQHYRNLSSQAFINFLSAYPFEVKFHRSIGRDTSDEWIVYAIKTV